MITLTAAYDGSAVLVNLTHVTNVRMARTPGQTFINFVNGTSVRVTEPFAEISKMIEEAHTA